MYFCNQSVILRTFLVLTPTGLGVVQLDHACIRFSSVVAGLF